MLTGMIAFYKPGSPEQLFLAVILALTFIVGYAREKPYKEPSASDLQLICQLQIFFTSFAGFAVKMAALLTAATDGAAANPFSAPGFSGILMGVGVAPLLLMFAQVVMEIVTQAKKAAAPEKVESDEVVTGPSAGTAFFGAPLARLGELAGVKKNPLGLSDETLSIMKKGKQKGGKSKKVLI